MVSLTAQLREKNKHLKTAFGILGPLPPAAMQNRHYSDFDMQVAPQGVNASGLQGRPSITQITPLYSQTADGEAPRNASNHSSASTADLGGNSEETATAKVKASARSRKKGNTASGSPKKRGEPTLAQRIKERKTTASAVRKTGKSKKTPSIESEKQVEIAPEHLNNQKNQTASAVKKRREKTASTKYKNQGIGIASKNSNKQENETASVQSEKTAFAKPEKEVGKTASAQSGRGGILKPAVKRTATIGSGRSGVKKRTTRKVAFTHTGKTRLQDCRRRLIKEWTFVEDMLQILSRMSQELRHTRPTVTELILIRRRSIARQVVLSTDLLPLFIIESLKLVRSTATELEARVAAYQAMSKTPQILGHFDNLSSSQQITSVTATQEQFGDVRFLAGSILSATEHGFSRLIDLTTTLPTVDSGTSNQTFSELWLALASAETYSETKNTAAALVKWRVSSVSEVTRNSIDIAYQQFRSLLGQMPASTLQQLRDEHATGTPSGAFIPDKIMLSSSIDLTVTGMDESVDEDKEGTSDKGDMEEGEE